MNVKTFFVSGSNNSQTLAGIFGAVKGMLFRKKKTKSDEGFKKIDLKSIRDPDFYKQKYWKSISFVLVPIAFYVALHYWATKAISLAHGQWFAIWLGWIAFGLIVASLTGFASFKNDKGVKITRFLYIVMALYFFVGLGWMITTNKNPLHIFEKYGVTSYQQVNVRSKDCQPIPASVTQPITQQVQSAIKNQKWIIVTYADNKRYVRTVTTGQFIYISNEDEIEFTTVVDNQGQASFSDKSVRIRVEKNGRLRFKLPVSGSIKYYIDAV